MFVKILKELASDKIIRETIINNIIQFSKNKTAKQLGIKIITEEELIEMTK
jgi:NAD-dependent DNA ligase